MSASQDRQIVLPLMRILGLWRPQAPMLALGALIALGALAAGIALMAAAGHFVAAAALGGSLVVPITLQVTGVARVVLRYLERLVTHDATFRALAALRVWFFRGLSGSAAGGLGFRRAGDVLSRLVGDIEALDGLYLRIIVPALGAVLLVPVLAVVIGRESIISAVIVLALLFLVAFLLPWRAASAAREAAGEEADTAGALRVSVLDALGGLREVKVFGAEGRMLAAVQAQESRLFAAARALASRGAAMQAAAFLAAQAALLAVLLIHGASPTAVVIAAFVTVAAFEAVGAMPRAGVIAGRAGAAATRVWDAATAPPPVAEPVQPAPMPPSSSLSFDSLRFRWSGDRPLVFDGLSLQLPAGARVAVLGPSGAGKSTLAALALKLASPEAGEIRLGGTDIATLRAEDVRARVAYLTQATHLFADTVRNNLLIARPEADEAMLWAALDAAQIGDMVRGLDDGLDAWVGEQGSQFSGGQGRRLVLARTLLSTAPILILDEPCTGLDLDTERAFMATLNDNLGDRSLLLITHRLTGVERLDRIWRLQSGKLNAATR